jgi:hypothetical protein
MADGNADEPSANGPLSIIIAFQSFPQGKMPRILQPKCLPALFLCYALQTQSIIVADKSLIVDLKNEGQPKKQ